MRGREPGHLMRPIANHDDAIQHFVDHDGAARQGIPPARLFNLKDPIVQYDRVVLVDAALMLDREDPRQVFAPRTHKHCAFLRRWHSEPRVKFGDVLLAQELVRLVHRRDPPHPQLLRQASLPGPVIPLHPAPRLRRIGRNHADSQLLQRPSDLR